MAVRAEIFDLQEPWRGPVGLSVALHGLGFAAVLLVGGLTGRGESWGGSENGQGTMSATLVSSAIPLPSKPAEKENVLATENPGLSRPEPKPQAEEAEAIPIPEKQVKAKPQKEIAHATPPKLPPPEPSNVVPYGEGGPVSGPFTMIKTTTGSGGMQFGAGGSFGSRYSWYVDTVRRKVSENWLKYEVDPSINNARRVYLTFDINRDGSPSNVQISQSSGIPSLDQSAVRALQRIDTFGALPNDYSGSRVSVEFWFDYRR
jgi:periplasmic protein TonB